MTIINIIVPSLGESITEGTIAKWYKKNGDSVAKDEILLDLETEKVTLEVRAEQNGVLQDLKANIGESVRVGQHIANIDTANTGAGQNISLEQQKKQEIGTADLAKNAIKSQEVILSPAAHKIAIESNLDLTKLQNPTGKDIDIQKRIL